MQQHPFTVRACLWLFAALLAASSSADELGDLRALVEKQNQLIEKLAARIEALEARDQELQAKIEEARDLAETEQAADAVQQPPSAEGNLIARTAAVAAAAPDDATGNLLENVVTRGDFPRSFKIPGTDVSLQVDGYVKFDFIHDDGLVLSGTRMFPDTISGAGNGDRSTSFSAEQSRVALFAQAPSPRGRISGFVEADFFGAGRGARLRHAYGRIGALLAGQTWSSLMDPYALPQSVALTAPSGSIFKRQVQIRWTQKLGESSRATFALEEPDNDFSVLPGGRRLQRWPDFIATVRHQKKGAGHVQLGGVLRRLEREDAAGRRDEATGWGLNLSSRLATVEKNSFVIGGTYGEGIGSYITGFATSPVAAAVSSSGNLEALAAFGGYLGYQHWWATEFKSNFSLGYAEVDNLANASGNAAKSTETAGVNLIWTPRPGFGMGLEYLFGSRENENGAEGELKRLQFAIQFGF